MGETRVDLYHLLQDLAGAYPGELEETVLTEIIANALDSGATSIALSTDASRSALTVADNGTGMRRADLRRFHDVAASSKKRGEGIGFAGVGIKLGLLISECVVTETRRGKEHVATRWGLTNRQRAPWQWIEPPGLVGERGTAVQLQLANALSPLLDRGYLESALLAHFEPLFDPYFDQILRPMYPHGIAFTMDGSPIMRTSHDGRLSAEVALKLPRKRIPSAFGYLVKHDAPLSETQRGVAISTYGKVIKRGWDWLGITPASADRVNGLIEAPALSASLTLNKADFLRSGQRGALYLSYRKGLQEAIVSQLGAWGDEHDAAQTRRRATRPVERDLEAVLADLSARFPMLAALVERRPGGSRKLATADTASTFQGPDLFSNPPLNLPADEQTETASEPSESQPADAPPPESERSAAAPPPPGVLTPDGQRKRQPARLGLTIQFESRGADDDIARLIESTVWVNDAHPAYQRAVPSRSEGYHLALSVALALASVAVTPNQERGFVQDFLGRWGEQVARPRNHHSRRR